MAYHSMLNPVRASFPIEMFRHKFYENSTRWLLDKPLLSVKSGAFCLLDLIGTGQLGWKSKAIFYVPYITKAYILGKLQYICHLEPEGVRRAASSKIRAASCGTYFINTSLCSFINVNYINCKLNVIYSTTLESREGILHYLEAHSFHKSLEMTYSIGRRLKAGWESLGIDMKMLCLMFKYSILSCSCIYYTKHSTLTPKQGFRACCHFIRNLSEHCRIRGLLVFRILGSHYCSRHSQSFAACGTDPDDTWYMHLHCHCHPSNHAGNVVRTTSSLSHWSRGITCIQFITKW